jgi:NSS family neurotransmitter:Na+ symporter
LTIYAATMDDFTTAISELFQPDFSKLSGTGILAAMSQAFFSLGLGTGAMLMYGAYLTVESKVPRLSLLVVGIDTFFAVVLALIIVTVLLAGNVALTSGPNLVFQALPLAFDHIPNGRVFLTTFLVLLALAAWTSSIWLAEPVMVWLSERFSLSLQKSAILCGVCAWSLGVITILSFNNWAFSFGFLGVVKRLGFFDVLQVMTAQLLLPLFGILATVFVGWILRPDITRDALHLRPSWFFSAWLWWMRLAVPVMLLIVLFNLSELFA